MNSMTGFGRAALERDGCEITVELKSVNHRFLDIGMRLPRALTFLEDVIRKTLQAGMARGHVDVFVSCVNKADSAYTVTLNEPLLCSYIVARERAAALTGLPNDAPLTSLLTLPDVLNVARTEEDAEFVALLCGEATRQALEALAAMRAQEGEKLAWDLRQRVEAIRALLAVIEQNAAVVAEEYREKLTARMEELLGKIPLDEARLANEVAIFADRSSITEEIVRLHSHFAQLDTAIEQDEPVGRKLDFIVQEVNREFNTIGSKANSLVITNAVMEAKGEVEKIREQIQNVE